VHEPGCWLIYPGPDAQLRFRPTLWPICGEQQLNSSLAKAVNINDPNEREAALDAVIDEMAMDCLNPCWFEIEQLAGQVGHLPLATLDIWRRFARSAKGMAALTIRWGTLPSGFVNRFDQELPFAWEAVSFDAWKQAMRCLQNQCKGIDGEEAGALIFRMHLESRIKDTTAVHESLNYLLGIACAGYIDGAQQQLLALRCIAGTARQRLFEGEDCSRMRLFQIHAEDEWPTGFNTIPGQDRKQDEKVRFLCPETYRFRDGVINMPLLLAAQVATNQTDQWFANPAAIHILRAHRAFDPEWFDEAFNLTIARCLAADLLNV
jgi:hypothetical protein